MPATDTLLHPARARTGAPAGRATQDAAETTRVVRRHRLACRACGEPWFGAVAYCPYCGRSAAPPRSAALPPKQEPRLDPFEPPAQPVARTVYQQPGTLPVATAGHAREQRPRGIRSLPVTLAGALVLVLLVLGLQDLLDRTTRARTPAPSPAVAAPAPRVETPPPQPVAPPAASHVEAVATPAPAAVPAPPPPPPPRNRPLCSAANEAAGLCNPN